MARALVFTLLTTSLLAASASGLQSSNQTSSTHKASKPAAHAAASTHKASARKASVPAHSASHSSHARKKRTTHRAAVPSFQLHPDPDRYRQIQQALADRGYYKGQVNGEWGDDSVDALRRFQTDQKLDNDGKIDARSLTGLGLGPKHDGSTAGTVPLSATNPVTPAPGSATAPEVPPVSELPSETPTPENNPPPQ